MSATPNNPLAEAYFRFLELAQVVRDMAAPDAIDANEAALLEAIVLSWHQGKSLTVREAIELRHLGSPATLHKRITRLRQKHFLHTYSTATDRRAKYLYPTEQALGYFARLGESLQSAQINA